MTLPGSSATIRSGGNFTVATHTVSSKDYQAVMQADISGHIIGSKPVYGLLVPSLVLVAAAQTVLLDIFNADATAILRILSIRSHVDLSQAVTGVGIALNLRSTSAVGTGGSTITSWKTDTSDATISASITCRSKPSGGATLVTQLSQRFQRTEETDVAQQIPVEFIPDFLRQTGRGIVLRQNQGLAITQDTNTNAGNLAFDILAAVE